MHIFFGILAAGAAIAFWIWRARMAAGAVQEVVDVADDVRAAVRRIGFRRQAGRRPEEVVDDARLIASGMMAAVARMDGDLTQAQTNAIRVECRASFRVDQSSADDIAAYGRWLAGHSKDPDDAIRRLGARLKQLANAEAHRDLVTMLERVAAVENGVSEMQRDAINRVRRVLEVA